MSATAEHRLIQQLGSAPPARLWRSLDERAGDPAFQAALSREFPELGARFAAATDRRTALKLLGMGLMISGLGACAQVEHLTPYVAQPEGLVPGRPRFYATTFPADGYGIGVLAESHEGRPTKLEGNPGHPASLGSTDAVIQAAVYDLYDPDRSRGVLRGRAPSNWDAFSREMAALREALLPGGGAGLGIVIPQTTSPTLARQLALLAAQFPRMRIYRHAPLAAAREAAVVPRYDLSRADVLVTLGADLLGEGPGKLAYSRAFSDRRRVRRGATAMSRVHAIEAVPSITGAAADRRYPVHPAEIETIARALAAGIDGGAGDARFEALLRDVAAAAPGRVLFAAGDHEAPATHAAVQALNVRAGAPGSTLAWLPTPEVIPDAAGDLHDLVADAHSGGLQHLVVLDADILHTAPGDLDVPAALDRLERIVHIGLHHDHTAKLAHWHIAAAHWLETWSDLRAFDGTASIVQPLIRPLFDGHSAHEVLAVLAGDYASDPLALVRATWADALDDAGWRAALQAGVIAGSAPSPVEPPALQPAPPQATTSPADLIAVVLRPDPWLRDGSNAGNLWLQELPRPLSKLVWGNAAHMSPLTAGALGVATDDLVEIVHGAATLKLPVFVEPGLATGVVSVALGFGRPVTHGDEAVGANAFPLRTQQAPWHLAAATVRRVEGRGRTISTQLHHALEGRDLLRVMPLSGLSAPPKPPSPEPPTLYPTYETPEEAWGMSIDLNTCIGCMACVSACTSENNTPVVGPDEMARGHDMHWLRVDRYYAGPPEAPDTLFQPVPCMQCEKAPCEYVCPVNATVHTHDGLNAQVYNRCVGTRYCSQNCPYKVRRFNFFDYQQLDHESPLSLLMNPDVTVRERGVMEKCTYCVQRISAARIDAEVADRPIADGEVVPACAQACPTRAITFGNIRDSSSAVAREKAEPQSYAMLEELGTRPRTTYLPRISQDGQPEASDG